MKIGVLTGGGDCPGLNAVIRAVVRSAAALDHTVVGIRHGWKGLVGTDVMELDVRSASGILHLGGTIIGTSRTNPFKEAGGPERVLSNCRALGIDAVVAVGGEGTLSAAAAMHEMGLPVVGVPKTIDNDIACTDYTFGFDTAVSIATEAIDRLHTTAESHNRIMLVEVMGRHAGWIALHAGIAGGADVILIPEKPVDIDEVCGMILRRHERGKDFSIVVVAEGARFAEWSEIPTPEYPLDEFGRPRLGGIAALLSHEIEKRIGFETRYVVLGHVQRGGTPTAHDRVLATRYGVFATRLAHEGRFGMMASLKGNEIVAVPLRQATASLKQADMELYRLAEIFFG
jgi:6-phosphofructokinase 1